MMMMSMVVRVERESDGDDKRRAGRRRRECRGVMWYSAGEERRRGVPRGHEGLGGGRDGDDGCGEE
jgi:hypothetical protein